jgi:PBSX family phage terminase large subunit
LASITFNKKLFNKIFWELKEASEENNIRYIWIYGGSSASKTFSQVQLTIFKMVQERNYNTMVMRKVSNDIKDSIFADFKGIISDWGLNNEFVIQQNFIINNVTGSYTRFRGLDDSEKVKGISRFKKVVLEEVNQFDEVDFKQIRKRLRGITGQQIVGIFNPISEDHWIKKNVFDVDKWVDLPSKIALKQINEAGNSIILKTNYLDNIFIVGDGKGGGFIDKHVIDDFERDKLFDYAAYEVYALGNWGKIITGGEFYKNFKREKHVGDCNYNSLLPLHISFDENVNPYFPCCIFQIEGKEIRMLNEVLGRNPNNTIKWVTREIQRLYPDHNSGMFIYGDATSQKDDVKQEKGHDLFRLIMSELKEYKPSRRVPNSNDSVVMRANFMNAMFIDDPRAGGLKFTIHKDCKEAITDFYQTKEDADGRKDKRSIEDKVTKVRYQPHGHIGDLTEYMICYAFSREYEMFKRGGKPSFSKAISVKRPDNTW